MRSLKESLERMDRLLYNAVCVLAGVAVFSMVILTFVDVMGRHFFTAVPGASEIISIQLGFVFFAGMSIVVRENGHIVVGILVGKYSPRFQVIEQFITRVVSVLVMALITWLISSQAGKLKDSQTLTAYLSLELATIAYLLATVALMATLFSFLRCVGFTQSESAANNPSHGDHKA